MGQVECVETATRLRNAVVGKASKYGHLDVPFIIAVNLKDQLNYFGPDDWIDVQNALLGDEICLVSVMTNGSTVSRNCRNGNGAWWGPDGPRHTQVSALLLACGLGPWSIASETPVVVHHPRAKMPLSAGLLPLPKAFLDLQWPRNEIVYTVPQTASAIFTLPNNWPR